MEHVRARGRQIELPLKVKIEEASGDILKWMFSAMAAQTGPIVALLKPLP